MVGASPDRLQEQLMTSSYCRSGCESSPGTPALLDGIHIDGITVDRTELLEMIDLSFVIQWGEAVQLSPLAHPLER